MNIYKTGLSRTKLVWFTLISYVVFVFADPFLNFKENTVDNFSFVASSIILAILTAKGYDNRLKNKDNYKQEKGG